MIEIENLTKTFGAQTVILDVSGIFYPGKIYGFVKKWFWKNSADEDDTWFY